MGVGLVALQSLLTIKKDMRTLYFQSNEPFPKFQRQQMATSKFLSDAFQENTRCVGDGVIHPPISLNLKKDNRTSDYQSNEPPPKFMLSPFLTKS